MKKFYSFLIPFLILLFLTALTLILTHLNAFTLFNPKGTVSLDERNLIITAVSIMLVVVIPALSFLIFVVTRYKFANHKTKYSPEWTGSTVAKVLLWTFPTLAMFVLAIVTWKNTHILDPYKPLPSKNPPLTIQVVALRWKWLFIYPKEHIASVNFVEFPVNTSISFRLTASDAPMSSFWIPSLGGQMYAMETMENQLHLEASKTGDFRGEAAEINGSGFSGMRFVARSVNQSDYDSWVKKVKSSNDILDTSTYDKLSQPSEDNPVVFYSSVETNLYDNIIMKYMEPGEKQAIQNTDSK
ncbi:MAG TPA: COX aromatic rich motif-containing protein [Patescibacteria group bacterium]